MLIGILQTGHAPDAVRDGIGDFSVMFSDLLGGIGFSFRTWNVVDQDFPSGADDAHGWLITGSKHGAYEDHPWIPPLEALIRDIHEARKPLIGICFGHQIIAQALGGRVEKFAGGWNVGRQIYDWDGRQVALNAWHQDQVMTPPEGAEILASNPGCAHAALRYGNHGLTIQPHPEFDGTVVQSLIETRGRGIVPDPQLQQAEATLHDPVDQSDIAALMARVLKGTTA